jgi:thioredoxin-dependent peroxiredoxin
MLNTKAPDFTLTASNGQEIDLTDLLSTFVVLIFYPMNDSPTCNRQLTEFSFSTKDFFDLNARIFGVNTATIEKQREYCTRKRLEFPILSDPGGRVAQKYKAHMRWLPFNRRTVVVIDPSGTVCYFKRGVPSHQDIIQSIKSRQAIMAERSAPV